ncbi:MAG: tetratricopeptide repeat protein [Planctomycetota bacterium]
MPGWCAESWQAYRAWRVRRTVSIPAPKKDAPTLPGLDCCYVEFPTATYLAPGGRDLRVTVAGEEAPFKVMDIRRDGLVRLAAPVPAGAKQMRVYYGNPKARAVDRSWSPERGVWLETRRFAGGNPKTLSGIRAAWAKAERDGRGPVAQIFHGLNPYGPSDNYLSLYTGWLLVPKDTTVRFSVIADDVAHLLVDNRPVAAKTKPGRMPRRKRFAGEPVALEQGAHVIQMYHYEASGRQAAGAAWWMPGMKRGKKHLHYKVIPASAYAPLRYGKLTSYEVQGQPVGADFKYVNAGDVLVANDRAQMVVRIEFRDTSRPANRALQCQPRWEFGDGTTSEARDPNHVYLKPGDYKVTLSLRRGGQAYQVTQTVIVGPGWQRTSRRQWDKLAQYYPLIEDYQWAEMPSDHLVVAARIFEKLEKPEQIIAVCQALFERQSQLDDATFVHHATLLARHLREVEGKATEALAVLTAAQRRAKDPKTQARLTNQKGDIYFYYLEDLEKALAQYTRTLKVYGEADATQARLAQIRIGDVYRSRGDAKAARAAYERAAAMPVADRSEAVESARRGSFSRSVEDYTRRKLFDEAHEALDSWAWEFPADRLVGFMSLLRARLALAEGKPEEAAKQADQLLGVNPDSEYADDLLLFLCDLHLRQNRPAKAHEAASRLLDEYPASDLQAAAHLKRVTANLRRAKYADAAAEALELADSHQDSEQAPKALLLAATAHLRQKQRDQAIQALERLTRTYPTSDEATQGIQMLKELGQT